MRTAFRLAVAAAALTAGCAFAGAPSGATSCSDAELGACDHRDHMPTFAGIGEQMVTGYLTHIGITADSLPTLTFIGTGRTASSQCVDVNGNATQNDRANNYCPTDNTVYYGQDGLWDSYRQFGASGPVSGLAHEYGHFLQSVRQVPNPRGAAETIPHENQADCFSGAFMRYLHDGGHILSPADLDSAERYLTATASVDAPGRDHGTARERIESFESGYNGGLPACSRFFPATPLTT